MNNIITTVLEGRRVLIYICLLIVLSSILPAVLIEPTAGIIGGIISGSAAICGMLVDIVEQLIKISNKLDK